MKVVILGWEEGFEKVKFNHFLRRRLGYSIGGAKSVIDQILRGERIELIFEDADNEEILKELIRFQIRADVKI